MQKQQWYFYFILLTIILLSLLFGNKKLYENLDSKANVITDQPKTSATFSEQPQGYIDESNIDLDRTKAKHDEIAENIKSKTQRNLEITTRIENERTQLEVLKKRRQEEINTYNKLNQKWRSGLYLDPIIRLQISNEYVINTAKSPERNLITDSMRFFNVDVNDKQTTIKTPSNSSNANNLFFNNDMNNYICFPVVYLEKLTFMFNLKTIDNVYYTVVSLTNPKTLNPGLHIDVQGLDLIISNALPSNSPWGIVIRYKRSSDTSHITYSYSFNNDTKKANVKLYENGNLVASDLGAGPLMASLPSYERPTTCIVGRSGDNSRAFYGTVANFKFFAWDLSDEIILKNVTQLTP